MRSQLVIQANIWIYSDKEYPNSFCGDDLCGIRGVRIVSLYGAFMSKTTVVGVWSAK